jgi:hypothetical protein
MYTMQGKTRPTCHVRFPHQSTYARRMLSVGGPRMGQPFMSHRQSWADPLLSRKRAPDIIHSAPVDRSACSYSASLPSQPMKQWGAKPSIYQRPTTRLTGPILTACDRYVQYLLTGTNPSVLNRHKRRLPHRKPRNSHNTLPVLPFWGFHWSP